MGNDRKCGACTLCCTAMAVPELDKPNGVPCVHLTRNGCGIYEDRPESCRGFLCGWRRGIGRDVEHRPDRTGAVLHAEEDASGEGKGIAWVAYADPSAKRGPLDGKFLPKFIDREVQKGNTIFVVTGDERQMFTHPQSNYSKIVREMEAQNAPALDPDQDGGNVA
jgi:hypothetical protein